MHNVSYKLSYIIMIMLRCGKFFRLDLNPLRKKLMKRVKEKN
jgi:hypothetical protein